jgi:hypothetical protein
LGGLSLAGCATSNGPPDTPLAHLRVDLAAIRAAPSAKITPRCLAALQQLSSISKDIAALQQRDKPVDPVSDDVLQSDQDEAEAACHPDAVRICQAPADPNAERACAEVVTPYSGKASM